MSCKVILTLAAAATVAAATLATSSASYARGFRPGGGHVSGPSHFASVNHFARVNHFPGSTIRAIQADTSASTSITDTGRFATASGSKSTTSCC